MPRFKAWQWIAVAAAAALGGYYFLYQPALSLADLAGRIPHDDRVMAQLDVQALRRSGLLERLAGKAGLEESDYQQFVKETGFEYRKDLDRVLLAYTRRETHFFLMGRFDWKRLEAYAVKQGGACSWGVCRLDSSTPGRKVSFRLIRPGILALASSPDSNAVLRLDSKAEPMADLPPQPVWILLPAAVLKDKEALPTGTHTIATAVMDAERVTLGIGPKDGRFEALLEARCVNAEYATQAMRQLESATALLNKMMARDKLVPNPRNLTGVLAGGRFRTEGTRLTAAWPIATEFFE